VVILDRELEVGETDGDARGHEEQYRVDNEEDTVESVRFTAPECSEYIVKLYRDCTTTKTKKI